MKKQTMPANEQGFTLVEVLISAAVITLALAAAIGLVTYSVSSIRVNKNKIIAAGLAQEGLEIVRNMRDNNWLHNCPACDRRTTETWRTDLSVGDSRVQYNSLILLTPFVSTPLKIDSNGFYQYSAGTDTPFKRRINIQYLSDDEIKVISEITWTEGNRNQIVSAELWLYNWMKE